MVQSYMAASDDNNATFQALKERFPPNEYHRPVQMIIIPFSYIANSDS